MFSRKKLWGLRGRVEAMAEDTLTVYREARAFQGSLMDLHPLKLDKWHRGLVGLPDGIYMQMGCPSLYEQVGEALGAVTAMLDLLGDDNLPLDPKEIARRKIRQFSWHTPSSSETGTAQCFLTWNQKDTNWELTCTEVPGTTKVITSFETGFGVGCKWVSDLEKTEG